MYRKGDEGGEQDRLVVRSGYVSDLREGGVTPRVLIEVDGQPVVADTVPTKPTVKTTNANWLEALKRKA